MRSGASFSADRAYRWSLWRRWDGTRPMATFVLLNPSTADERRDDPTIRRCAGFARRWGCGGVEVINLFALRATDPRALAAARDPVGARNDAVLRARARRAPLLVLGWGDGGRLGSRGADVRALLGDAPAFHFGRTRRGEPRHPLYLRRDARLVRWRD